MMVLAELFASVADELAPTAVLRSDAPVSI